MPDAGREGREGGARQIWIIELVFENGVKRALKGFHKSFLSVKYFLVWFQFRRAGHVRFLLVAHRHNPQPACLISMPMPKAAGMESSVMPVENIRPQDSANAMGATKGSKPPQP